MWCSSSVALLREARGLPTAVFPVLNVRCFLRRRNSVCVCVCVYMCACVCVESVLKLVEVQHWLAFDGTVYVLVIGYMFCPPNGICTALTLNVKCSLSPPPVLRAMTNVALYRVMQSFRVPHPYFTP